MAQVSPQIIGRIWRRDVSVWTADPSSAVGAAIAKRLGWLDVPTGIQPELDRVHALADEVVRDGIHTVCLLGMGGSSLCAEVMRAVYGVRDGHPQLAVMDTTDEAAIHAAASRLDARRTLFLVASKSGGTIEVASMEKLFWQEASRTLGADAGRQFAAITDPGTALARLSEEKRYRRVFLNPPDIGGRFSALSLFGLVPCALIGGPVKDMLAGGVDMAVGCREEHAQNPGYALGVFMGETAAAGRDKLTVVLPPSLRALGLWIEQLVAESTGKHGKGSLPIVDEPLGPPAEYGPDRAFVSVATEHEQPDIAHLQALRDAGHPVFPITTRIGSLGAEFFRWEFATAIAGAMLGINPFDEPNVSEAKDKTKAILEARDFADGASATKQDVRHALGTLRARDYVAFLSYLPADAALEAALLEIRLRIRADHHVASTFGIGPRYLHSTGQYHKGGPNTILAFVITGEDETETPVPGAPYSFKQLKRAQAVGDSQTLAAHDRRTVRIHVDRGADAPSALRELFG